MFKVEVGEPDYIIQVYEDKQIFGKLVNYHFHPNAVEGVVNYTSPQCDNGAADGFHPTVSPLAPLNKDIPIYQHITTMCVKLRNSGFAIILFYSALIRRLSNNHKYPTVCLHSI